ncbi:XRN-Two Binding Domain, XTBD [Popillia japonica]|uniref:XRN-Two Binding Domain, XTBD n=1 Tax=Popillia japonica TaxID=7064 RepID=A0AAW1NCM7_POPJA
MAQKGTFAADWEVDKHREDTDTEEHWKLRKLFMEINKGQYPENHLVDLSKAFINMHFLDCQYSAPVTAVLKKLAQNIPRDNYPEETAGPSELQNGKRKRSGSQGKGSKKRKL